MLLIITFPVHVITAIHNTWSLIIHHGFLLILFVRSGFAANFALNDIFSLNLAFTNSLNDYNNLALLMKFIVSLNCSKFEIQYL